MDKTVLDYFQKVAKQWDTLRADYFDESVIIKALEHAHLDKTMIAVDVGTGTGFVAAGLAPLAQRVIGIDFSQAMLDKACENIIKLGLMNVEFRQGDVEHLPLEDESADAVFANMALHHTPDPLIVIREMARVVKRNGRIVITDATRHAFEWFKAEMADVWLGFNRQQIESWFEAAGLSDIRYELVGTQ